MKILGLIPARGGSKGIPKKNIIDLGGVPLISYTISAALRSKKIDKVVVSSDDDEILSISKKYGALTIYRPAELSGDEAPIDGEKILPFIIDNAAEALDIDTFDDLKLTGCYLKNETSIR